MGDIIILIILFLLLLVCISYLLNICGLYTVNKIDKLYKKTKLIMPKILYTDKGTNTKYIAFLYNEFKDKIITLSLYKILKKDRLEIVCEDKFLWNVSYNDTNEIITTLNKVIIDCEKEKEKNNMQKKFHNDFIELP